MAANGRGCVKTRSKTAIVGQCYTPQRNRVDAIPLRATIVRLTTIRRCTFSTENSVSTFLHSLGQLRTLGLDSTVRFFGAKPPDADATSKLPQAFTFRLVSNDGNRVFLFSRMSASVFILAVSVVVTSLIRASSASGASTTLMR